MTREGEPISQLTIRLAEEVIRLSREPGKPRDAAVEWAEHVMVIIEAEIEARDNPPAPEAGLRDGDEHLAELEPDDDA